MAKNDKFSSRFMGSPGLFQQNRNSPFFGLPAFDIETTGLSAQLDTIVQAGFSYGDIGEEINILQSKDLPTRGTSQAWKILRKLKATGAKLTSLEKVTLLNEDALSVFNRRGFFLGLQSYRRGTLEKEVGLTAVKERLDDLLKSGPLIIHNVQFERSFLESAGYRIPIDEGYWQLLKSQRDELQGLESTFLKSNSSLSSVAFGRKKSQYIEKKFQAQIGHQLAKYEHFKGLAQRKGRGVIDTQELAKTAIGLMQQKGNIPGVGIIPRTRDIFTGSSVEFLGRGFYGVKELHQATADAWLQQSLAPDLATLIEKLKDPTSAAFTESELRFMRLYKAEQASLKTRAIQRQITSSIEKIERTGVAEFERGNVLKTSVADTIEYFKKEGARAFFKTSSYEEIAGFDPEKTVLDAIESLSPLEKKKIDLSSSKFSKSVNSVSDLKIFNSKYIPHLVGGIVLGAFAYNLFSGRDDAYNKIEGFGEKGFSSKIRKEVTPFGSGFHPYSLNANYASLVSDFNKRMEDPDERKRVQLDVKEKQAAALAKLGGFSESDYIDRDLSTLEALNRKRKELREINLANYEVTADDADTILLKNKSWFSFFSKPISIRLSGVDAPEIGEHADEPLAEYRIFQEQPFGKQSAARFKQLLGESQDLRLIVDPTQKTYGRYLGTLYSGSSNLQLQMVREGSVSSLEFGKESKDIVDRSLFSTEGGAAELHRRGIWSHPFFQNWRSFSRASGRDVTFNSFTDLLKLNKNDALAKGGAQIWSEDFNPRGAEFLGGEYRGSLFKSKQDNGLSIEETQTSLMDSGLFWAGLKLTGVAGAIYLSSQTVNLFKKPVPIKSLSYFQTLGGIDLGREAATYGDVAYNALRRFEYSLGGLPKTFSLSSMLSSSVLKDSAYSLSLLEKGTEGYAKYLDSLTKRSLISEGFSSVSYEKGKLYGLRNEAKELLLENARIIQRTHDYNVSPAASQFAESLYKIKTPDIVDEFSGLSTEKFPYLITGAKTRAGLYGELAHGFAHETLTKYLRLMDDPVRLLRDVFSVSEKTKIFGEDILAKLPKLGVGGESHLRGSVPKLLKKHALTFLPKAFALPFAYGTIDWAIRSISPEDTVAGKAGLTGLLAEGAKTAHLTYANLSDWSGATSLRQSVEDEYKGSTGLLPWFGLASSGAITGYATGALQNIYEETLSANKYQTLSKNLTELHGLAVPQIIKNIPGLGGSYSRTGRYGRYGAIAGGLLGLPFLLTGLGSKDSYSELAKEYSGEKEVAVYKGRWWEMGQTPWEGQKIDYYRPNWYQRLLSGYKEKSIWEEENVSPLKKLYLSLTDPYYLEKKHYEDRPYPVTGPSGEGLGIFGPLYRSTIGAIIKPPLLMQREFLQAGVGLSGAEKGLEPSQALGGLSQETPVSPYGYSIEARRQLELTNEALGLRGFIFSKFIKGDPAAPVPTYLQSASGIDSPKKSFWELNLGGGFGTTEFMRRILQKNESDVDYINTIPNRMPSWMPGEDYFIDFKTGDPYSKITEGEYRLPGKGYEARYKDLEGINPEDYPLAYRHKILGDVAMYSRDFRETRASLLSEISQGSLSDIETKMFLETEEQIKNRKHQKTFEKSSDSLLAKYYGALVDTARANPLEQLTPLSPAHKFLPPSDPLSTYADSLYGKEFKKWENPIQDFIVPTFNRAANIVGWTGLPERVNEQRNVEDYFDKLSYIKGELLQAEGQEKENQKKYKRGSELKRGTIAGMDAYADPLSVMRALSPREKPYFLDLLAAPEGDREKILSLSPENLRDIYTAQWENIDRENLELLNASGGISEASMQEKTRELDEKRTLTRMRRQAIANQLTKDTENLPGSDWIGWREDVDLEDIKLKYILDQGEDYHAYGLWENRLKLLHRKPYLEDAMRYVNIPDRRTRYQDLYNSISDLGVENIDLSVSTTSFDDSVSLQLQQDRSNEIDASLRKGGYIK